MINILLFKRPWSMDDPYIRVVHRNEGDCVVHAVTALCGKRVLRGKRYCMVEKTTVPQIVQVHRIGRGCTAHTLVRVRFEYLLVDSN